MSYTKYDREKYLKNKKKRIAQVKKWQRNNKELQNVYSKRWQRKNENKRIAQRSVKYAIEKGILIRPGVCSKCLIECQPDGHHEDYSKPLEIMWLCRQCHKDIHSKNN